MKISTHSYYMKKIEKQCGMSILTKCYVFVIKLYKLHIVCLDKPSFSKLEKTAFFMPIHSRLLRHRRLNLWNRRKPQSDETKGNQCSKPKGRRRQKHHCLQLGGRSCDGRQESPATGRRPPGRPHQDTGLVQAP